MPYAPATQIAPQMPPLIDPPREEPPNAAPRRSAHQRNPPPGNPDNHVDPVNRKPMRANINIASLNMNGFAANGASHLEKWSMVNQTLNKHKIAILAL